MMHIACKLANGDVHIITLVEGGRLATEVRLQDGTVLRSAVAVPVDQFMRGWPVAGARATWAETESEWAQRILDKDAPEDTVQAENIQPDAFPADKAFRPAWVLQGSTIAVDIAKARDVQRNVLRALRKPLLEALDVNSLRALERGDVASINAILATKQALRDVTASPEIDDAVTTDDLKTAGIAVIENAATVRGG